MDLLLPAIQISYLLLIKSLLKIMIMQLLLRFAQISVYWFQIYLHRLSTFASLSAPIDFQLFIENFLEMAKKQTTFASRTAKEKTSNKLLKARNPNLYYENLHIEYYYFASNMRTILRQPGPRCINAYFLRFFSYRKRFFSIDNNTKVGLNKIVQFCQSKQSLKPLQRKTLEILLPLQKISEVKLEKTPSTN